MAEDPTADPAPAGARPSRRTLLLIMVPIVGFYAAAITGDAIAPRLVDTHPLLLIAMNPRNRNLLLATNQLDPVSYYVVGALRLLASDPLHFLLGYLYGDAALTWMARRTRSIGSRLQSWETKFRRASYAFVFVAPNNFICLFAGAAGMSIPAFLVVNVSGTFARLFVLRTIGDVFEAPIDDVLGFIGDNRTPLLILSVLLVGALTYHELRNGGGEIDELLGLEAELHAGEAGPEPHPELP